MSQLLQDARYAIRMLTKSPGFSIVAVLTLALGIGANTAMFSVIQAVLLEPFPYPESDRVVIAARSKPGMLRTIASYPDFEDWRQSGVFTKLAAVVGRGFFLDTREGPVPISGRRVTEEFFDVLRSYPVQGRSFTADESRKGQNVAVVSHQFWTKHLGRDPQAVGKELRLRGQIFHVVGVLSPDFADPIGALAARDVYVPLLVSNEERVARNSQWVQVVGRLRPDIPLHQAAAEIETVSAHAQRDKAGRDPRTLAPFSLISLREHFVGKATEGLWLLFGAVGFVLLIGCANVSNLLLARITARQHELAVRAALGASARRLAAQLMTESLLLSAAGGTLALVFVLWTVDVIKTISPVNLPRLESAGLDMRVFGFALLATMIAGLLFGLLPVLRGARQDVVSGLKQAAGTGSVAHARSRNALLTVEVALTVVLLVGAALSISSFERLLGVDPGFQTGDVLTVDLSYASGDWKNPQQWAFFQQLIERVSTQPGVRAVGVVDNLPLSGSWSQFSGEAEGYAPDVRPEMRGKVVQFQMGVAGGDYFQVMRIPLKSGRIFDSREASSAVPSVIIGESLAKELWGDADPIGRSFAFGENKTATVIGVVGDVRHFGLETKPVHTLYRAMAQGATWGGTLVVLTDRDPSLLTPAIRQAVREIDGSVVFRRAQTMDDLLKLRTASPRFMAVLLGSFSGMALLLAAVGIYAVVAYSVAQRTREIGVRIALGAPPAAVLRMVVRGGLQLAGLGVVIGLAGALALSRYLRAQLFEVSATEPMMYAMAALVVIGVTVLACYVPARRASHVDPMTALRYE